VARARFASRGFDATTLSAVATDAGISLTALYYYVENKSVLYVQVVRATMASTGDAILAEFKAAEPGAAFHDRRAKLVGAIATGTERAETNGFLAAAPMEMLRHPELAHLLRERDEIREPVLEAVFEPLATASQLSGFADSGEVFDAARLIFAGWAMESFFQPDQQPKLTRALLGLAATLAASAAQQVRSSRRASSARPAPKTSGQRPV
jgi:AcrR family transcriptional regulator